jgi:hypothetical protein
LSPKSWSFPDEPSRISLSLLIWVALQPPRPGSVAVPPMVALTPPSR